MMAYVEGFLAPVPVAAKEAFLRHAEGAWEIFKSYGAIGQRECWGDDVPEGQHTSFPMAVKLEEGEVVVFSWIEWPDRETRDAGMARMQSDPRWEALGEMPFDARRVIFGGFVPIFAR